MLVHRELAATQIELRFTMTLVSGGWGTADSNIVGSHQCELMRLCGNAASVVKRS